MKDRLKTLLLEYHIQMLILFFIASLLIVIVLVPFMSEA